MILGGFFQLRVFCDSTKNIRIIDIFCTRFRGWVLLLHKPADFSFNGIKKVVTLSTTGVEYLLCRYHCLIENLLSIHFLSLRYAEIEEKVLP